MPPATPTGSPESQASLLALALASTANAVFITDETGKIVWVNDAFSRLSGYSPDDTIGRTPAILQSGKQERSFYSELWQTILKGTTWKGEIVDQRKDGSLYSLEEVITPLFNERGEITHFIAIQHDITHRKALAERDHHLAYHDALTGLPNRMYFLEMLQQSISQAKRTQRMFATLFMDLDNFKPVNDRLGHHTGDQLLIVVAERLRAAVRQADIVSRFGGDEFAILLTDLTDQEIAATLARKLLGTVTLPFMLRGEKINVSASIGIAIYPHHGEGSDILLMNADNAMYQAKCHGGNNYQFYDASFSRHS